MSKRFTDTSLWDEDWYIALPKDYRTFFNFLKDSCDHAGIWKPNLEKFNKLFDCEIELQRALKLFNAEKERILVLKNGRWFLTGFIPFQYGTSLNHNNRVHNSILNLLKNNEVNLTSIRPQLELIEAPKDKEKARVKERIDVFIPPTFEEVKAFSKERNSSVDPELFFHHYEQSKWVKPNGQRVLNWKSTLVTWERRNVKPEQLQQQLGKRLL